MSFCIDHIYTLIPICSKASHIENILYMRHLTSALKISVLFYIEFLYIYICILFDYDSFYGNYLFKNKNDKKKCFLETF